MLLYAQEDRELNANILCKEDYDEQLQKLLLDRFDEMVRIATGKACIMQQVLTVLGKKKPKTCRHCTNCQRNRRVDVNLKYIKMGIHTIELYAKNFKYHQIQKTIDYLVDQRSIQRPYSDPYSIDRHLKSVYMVDRGVRMLLHQSHNKSNGISFAVNPSTLLAKCYQPMELYRPAKANVAVFQSWIGDIMDELHLSDHGEPILAPAELSLSRMDLTADLYFSKSADISSLIRLFHKSMLPRHYKRGELEGKQDYFFQLATKKSPSKSTTRFMSWSRMTAVQRSTVSRRCSV